MIPDPSIEPWHLPHTNNQPNDAMKASHLTTPRQLADCTFTVGCPEMTRTERAGHGVLFWFSMVGLCVTSGLLIVGAL